MASGLHPSSGAIGGNEQQNRVFDREGIHTLRRINSDTDDVDDYSQNPVFHVFTRHQNLSHHRKYCHRRIPEWESIWR
ncbi:Uncharacterised protein [Vibrio cholerae]|uniref:Uncharacterized protein n=1 Tax=Vibrio cholerae TaxID=666 RepID=A0A655X3D6_VIBCL|nr:Uncharacterised protein [Vibrio cholerae]CSB34705.1 Uncharacterised protein [Vibrio cholerae]CSB37959.1 Uncharacterised protein [Vibrio cholerae]CSC04121.1 Uncharacterised protein [Vibrio cholerae]CSD30860.1 Uncharacterised protein [Vibrio cholerae]